MMRIEISFKCLVLLLTVLIANVKGGEVITCTRGYDKVGCYDEYNPGIKDLIVYDRYGIQWKKIVAYMHNLACKCEAKARDLNKGRSESEKYVGFALHFWGECYGRTQAQINALALRSKSARCSGDQTLTKCYEKNSECTGHAFSEFVYNIRPRKDEKRIIRHCTEDGFKIVCSEGLKVHVIEMYYGEKTASQCGKPFSVGWKAECSNIDSRTFSIYYKSCIKESICDVPNWFEDPNDPCKGVKKYINVKYQCKE